MQKPLLWGLFVAFAFGTTFSQSVSTPTSNGTFDCSDPLVARSSQCNDTQLQNSNGGQGRDNSSLPVRNPVLNAPTTGDQYSPNFPSPNPSQISHPPAPAGPATEFEQMVADSVGRELPLFG